MLKEREREVREGVLPPAGGDLGIAVEQIRLAVQELAEALQKDAKLPALGLRRSARLPFLAALHAALNRPLLLVTDRADRALNLAEELAMWAPAIPRLYFPEPTPLFYENAAWGEATRHDRLMALTALAAFHIPGAHTLKPAPVLITPARALMTRTIPRRDFLKATRTLRRGQTIQIDELIRNALALGYESSSIVIAPGQFARRGGILDLWTPSETHPARLEFFGDEIETVRRFDAATQRTFKADDHLDLERILLSPAREYLIGTANPLASSILQDISADGTSQTSAFTEFHIPFLHPTPASILDYLPRQSLVVLDDFQAFADTINDVEAQALSMRNDSVRDGTLSEDFPIPYLTWDEIQDSLGVHPFIEIGPASTSELSTLHLDEAVSSEYEPLIETVAQQFLPGPRFGGRLKPVMDHMLERTLSDERVIVVSRQSARLQELWAEQGASAATKTPPIFIEGSLGEGWTHSLPGNPPLHLLTDGEIFGWRRPEPRYKRSDRYHTAAEAPETAYSDLQPGDWVVHVDHGIGRFSGLVRRTVDGVEHEYLCIEYADEAQLFVPVHQVDRLTRYVGPDNRTPTPSRLGGTEWKNVRAHVKEAVVEVAEELLDLYARRNIVEGHAFPVDSSWQQELEASFPYIETEDQLRVLADVKRDMESPHPMDRLICGDVGYGKTEVALRAAFKSVMDGKQVAVLVPTTVLAQQHLNTFQQRLAAFPVSVEMLSRFRTPQQQREITLQLMQGGIDIIIGTHRLLSSDVKFKDLGLLIIDEEQRFGVTHKETLKKMRTEVDVLTLTATPIPRTLYMALSGVRDISTINTPPEERLPVVTHVGPYSPRLARQAILREMERGGQVFFVHNRVQTINAMRTHLEKLVPEARITVAHGQMPEHELSERMQLFSNGEVDILLCTSIIESGLDIPNANTLIIDRADTFGLAQLYQLRGRVGRGAQRAYAYFFRHNRITPTIEGRQRLETIAENTQLGAGFSIAMRDLEIRGTGDILGTRQHGHIADVGFHLYTRLLAEAVRRLRQSRGLPAASTSSALEAAMPVLRPTPNIELPFPANIPLEYIPEKNIRLGLYRRMANFQELAEVEALAEELADRFGPLPETVHNLLFQLKIKLLAENAGLASISPENGQIVLRYPENQLPARLPDLGANVRVGKIALWVPYTRLEDWQQELFTILEKLQPRNVPQ